MQTSKERINNNNNNYGESL